MSNENELPSQDPADSDSLAGVLRNVFKKMLQNIDGMLPAKVISYDRKSNLATVQAMIQMVGTSGNATSRATTMSIPVLALGGGGFVINFPIKAGDKGWIEASDRDISLYMQGKQNEAKPNTLRLHSFEDGRFIPDIFGEYEISEEDQDGMVIQSLKGESKIVIKNDSIDFVSDTINLKAKKTINLNAGGGTGATGGFTSQGTTNLNGETTIEGDKWKPHTHSGIVPGNGNTGGVT